MAEGEVRNTHTPKQTRNGCSTGCDNPSPTHIDGQGDSARRGFIARLGQVSKQVASCISSLERNEDTPGLTSHRQQKKALQLEEMGCRSFRCYEVHLVHIAGELNAA